jgi:cold shock CspA family protein
MAIGTVSYAAVVTSAQVGPISSSHHAAVQDKTTTTNLRKAVPEVASSASDSKRHAVVVCKPINKRKYTGRVSWFRGSYGWVHCAEISAKYNGLDAFLHINDCDFKPFQGHEVEFRLATDEKGHPKAVQAQQAKAREVINARDWFALKQRR